MPADPLWASPPPRISLHPPASPRRRPWIAGVGALAVASLAATAAWTPRPIFLWNASASSPVGLYWVAPAGEVRVGDMLVARLPAAARAVASERHYVPAKVPLVKRAGAVTGHRVCAKGRRIHVDGRRAAWRRRVDARGRRLPWWTGCRRLARGEVLLLSQAGAASFDGRYFGPSRAVDIVGKARLLWAR